MIILVTSYKLQACSRLVTCNYSLVTIPNKYKVQLINI